LLYTQGAVVSRRRTERLQRIFGAFISAAVLAAVFSPLSYAPGWDSFPFSSYPMFAQPRPDARVELAYALGVTAAGTRVAIPPGLVANSEVLQARAVIQRAANSESEAADLCRHIAARVRDAAQTDRDFAEVSRIEIVRGSHDAVAYLARGARGPESVVVACEVPVE
jgi:hypothetical protein